MLEYKLIENCGKDFRAYIKLSERGGLPFCRCHLQGEELCQANMQACGYCILHVG